MQQILVTAANSAHFGDLLEAAYRFRHRFFVDHMRWEALRKPDDREVDQFDDEHCAHVIGVHRGEVVTYTRLLPSNRPHLLSHVYPELLQGADEPTGPDIWEWTRCAVDPARREGGRGSDLATATMTLGVTEACLHLGVSALHVQTHPMLLTRLIELGWRCRPLALPTVLEGKPVLPFIAGVDSKTLENSRAVLGISIPVLEIAEASGKTQTVRIGGAHDA